MLVLTRQRDERIMIGEDIVITVVEIRRGHVRLGIDAPASVPVHREEVYLALKQKEQNAAGNNAQPGTAGTNGTSG
jgi:carbon storage regulator